MDTPGHLRYTEEHEWVEAVDGVYRIGITDYAQDQLGDIVYVDLPDVGRTVTKGDTILEIESTKSVGEVYAPFTGTIVARNDALIDTPELINTHPYTDGWLIVLGTDEANLDDLLDAEAYSALVT